MKRPEFWLIEEGYFAQGYQLICGVDEAGVGPLAGPVYAAAVILPRGWDAPYLNDSKKVTEKRREVLYEQITQEAVDWAISWANEEEIDQINILNARMLAMDRAIHGPNQPIVGGDGRSASIAAASILAKVSRDRFMRSMAVQYPQYAFEQHKGYPTKLHYARLREYGPCPIHRQSFLKKL